MTTTAIGLVLAFVIQAAAPQQKPDFSGRWVGVSPAENAGNEQVITQDASTLRTGHPSEGGSHSSTYNLDGTESKNIIVSHGEDIVTLSRAVWNGNQLVVTEATTYPDGRKSQSREVWSLDAQGQLVIELTMTPPGQTTETKMTLVYRKQ
jgi:hypothetical protein